MYKDDIYKWIIECYNTLTPSEKKVADCLLAKKSAITTMSITDVADAADVSTATVTRFCRSIGLESFAECRLSITRTLAQEENGNHPREDMYSELQADDTVEEKSRKLYTISNNALTQTLALLDYKKISEAVDLISRANRVYCFGQGTSSSTAMDAWTRFTAVTPKFQWIGDTHAQAYTASILGKNDLVLYFSFSGAIRELMEVTRKPDDADAASGMDEEEKRMAIERLEEMMLQAANNLDFEKAAKLRDQLLEMRGEAPQKNEVQKKRRRTRESTRHH